uniref:polynucleotide adenylyltransferase n=1 Tax=Meloidogyne enterolobii TaxID=390850 RepID=A0A6V7V062_MELEN|nr:unnamed protein product [Meloidogyne enterolobii]
MNAKQILILGVFCQEHDFIFGEGVDTFNSTIKLLENDMEDLKVNSIPYGRVPLIEIQYKNIEIDIMFAIDASKINTSYGDLTNYASRKIILDNLRKIDGIIEEMVNADEKKVLTKSVIILAGYRIAYRLKYFLIDDGRRPIFTNLLRTIKLWAKKNEIYSNMFGYLSGTILTIMCSKIILIYTSENLLFLIKKFFLTFANWDWPMPVLVEPLNPKQQLNSKEDINLRPWEITDIDPSNGHEGDQMPVISPLYPEQNTAYNVNLNTRKLITKIMKEAYNLLKNEGHNNYLKLFENFDYKKYYNYFILITCLETEIQINNNCISVKAKLRKTLFKWADLAKIKDQIEQYHVISSFQRKEENCLIKGLYGPCTTWIVGIKLINDSENEVTNFAKESIEMLSYYTKSLNKGSVMVFSFFVSESEIDQKISSFIYDKTEDPSTINDTNKIQIKNENRQIYRQYSQVYYGPTQNLRKENPLDHNKLTPPNSCDNYVNGNFVFLPKLKDLEKGKASKNKKEKFSKTKNKNSRKGRS